MARSTRSTRIGEAERGAAQRALHDHLNAGRLQVNEYAERSAAAAGATTAAEIGALFTDLPAPRPKLPGSPGRSRALVALGAVAVLAVVGVVAFAAGRGGQEARGPSAATLPPPTVDAAPPAVPVAPSTEAATASAEAGGAASAAAVPPGVTVRRSTDAHPITLRPSYGVDLDDDTSPNWNVGQGCCDRDIGWADDGSSMNISRDYAVMSGAADYLTCAQETAYTSGPIERRSLAADENICVRTSGGRYALVTIISVSDQALQFRSTVWDAS